VKRVRVAAFGGPETVELVDAPEPSTPGPGEVLLAVEACGLNFSDLLQRAGLYPGGPRPPFFAGQEAAGVVIAVGAGVGTPAVGTRVVALAAGGLFAERAVVAASACFTLPDGLSFVDGAALPVSLFTAGCALATLGRARAGETAVIHAAGGALGTMAVQLARRLGLTVVATASTAEKRTRAAELGADVACSYDEFEGEARRLTDGCGPELVFDSVGGELFRRSLAVLRPFGRLLLVGCSSGEPPRPDGLKLIHRSQAVIGFHLGALLDDPARARQAAAELMPWVVDGAVRPQVGHTLPLAEAPAAHELLMSRRSYGKIVLLPGG
jgi:NADPH2:quinone reductase